jgi:DNA ligase-1
MNRIHDPIYKRDSQGKLRFWYMEQNGDRHRTFSGLMNGDTTGTITATDWTVCQPTNVGRANERDAVAQAAFEIEAQYEKKLSREYHRDKAEALAQGAKFFKPMLAQKYEEFVPGFAQPKLDGVRCIATINGLFSREGKPIPGAAHIFEALQPAFDRDPDLIFDGELYNHALKDDFNTIISLVKKANPDPERAAKIRELVQYHVYDLPSHPGTFDERSDELNNLVKGTDSFDGLGASGCIVDVETYVVESQDEYDDLHGTWLEAGYEGSMHRLDAPYEQKRSKTLRKRKEFQDEEFEVIRIEEGLGNWSGAAKRVVCRLPDGREFGAGIKGSMARARELLNEDHKVVTIQFFAYTPDGVPRFPVATKFHGAERTL